jgi:hypothetical protein
LRREQADTSWCGELFCGSDGGKLSIERPPCVVRVRNWASSVYDNDWIEREGQDGKKVRVLDPENVRHSKLRIGALQWRISKLRPKRYLTVVLEQQAVPGPACLPLVC